uniref:Uncharacterized protein n=1 Tax=Picea sitchensis TaxID=3332 RepID=A9NWG4_PICSI|nr:unknown [Picea sitchensis]
MNRAGQGFLVLLRSFHPGILQPTLISNPERRVRILKMNCRKGT